MSHSTGPPRSICATCIRHRCLHVRHWCRAIAMRQELLATPRLFLQKTEPDPAEVQRLRPRATGHLLGRNSFPPYAGRAPLHHLHRPQAHYLRLPAEVGQMLTAPVQLSRLCRPVHDKHTAHICTGRCRRRPLSRRIRHCATILRCIGGIAGHRLLAPNTSGVNHRPAARGTANPRYHGLQLLRYVCWEI
jgi:hypothetical protein